MRLLLFFVSFSFSIIFYLFHLLSKGTDFFGKKNGDIINFNSITGNLLIESFIFLFIAIFFVFYFTPVSSKNSFVKDKTKLYYFLFYIVFIAILYFIGGFDNLLVLTFISLFIISDLSFNFVSNIFALEKYKIKIRIISLIASYFSMILGFYILFKLDFFLIVLYVLLYLIVYNIFIHKKFTNYISLTISIVSVGILFYYLFLSLEEFLILF